MSEPADILVVRLSALGDVVLASAVARALRERFPTARIEFLAGPPHGRILEWVGGLDSVHLVGRGDPVPDGVRERRWDLLVDLSGTGRSRRLLRAVGARRRVVVAKQTIRRFAFVRLRALNVLYRMGDAARSAREAIQQASLKGIYPADYLNRMVKYTADRWKQ